MHRAAFVTSHPIQYQVPIFRLLAQRRDLEFTVFFCHVPDGKQQGDGFGVDFQWDLPLLEGYSYEILQNVAREPSVTSYYGCDTPGIAERFRRSGFDAVVVNGWVVKSCLQALHACRRLGIPCIVRGEANHLRPRPWWKRLLQRALIRQYAGYLYIGEANRRFYESYGARADQLFPARYCIENDRFARAAQDSNRRISARTRWSIPDRVVCYLCCGKLIPKKHPLELLQAIQHAIAAGANLHLLVVGDGELRRRCEQFAQDNNLPVTFAGFLNQTEIVDAYLASDCLVLPSDYGETWGLVVNEAMACGRAAIVSDQVGCRQDLIIEGRTGLSFPFSRWSELADRLTDLASNRSRLRRMGEAAAKHVAQYSPAAAVDGIAQAVKYVCRG